MNVPATKILIGCNSEDGGMSDVNDLCAVTNAGSYFVFNRRKPISLLGKVGINWSAKLIRLTTNVKSRRPRRSRSSFVESDVTKNEVMT